MEETTHDLQNQRSENDLSQRHEGGLGRAKARVMVKPGNGKRVHRKIEALVSAIAVSLSKESLQYLKGPDGEAALADIVTLLAHAAFRFLVTEEARHAVRAAAAEAATVLYDGLGFKAQELAAKVPRFVLAMAVVVVGAYAVLVAVGLLLCLWRFSLYGVVQAPLW